MNQVIPIESLKVVPNSHKKIIGQVGSTRFESDNIPIDEPVTVKSLIKALEAKGVYLRVTATLLVKDAEDNAIAIQEGNKSTDELL